VIGLIVGLPALLLAWFLFVCSGWLFQPSRTVWNPPVHDPFGAGIPGFEVPGTNNMGGGQGKNNKPGVAGKGTPIQPNEFKEVLRTLQSKPPIADLRDLAGRLALTNPTEEQRKKHESTKTQRALARAGAGPSPNVLEALESSDDMLQVSKTLNPLLRDNDRANKKAGALAMQKWGTEENVMDLAANVEGNDFFAGEVRKEAAKALAFIGDERGVPALTRQVLSNFHDRVGGLKDSLLRFGAKAEPEVLKYLKTKGGFDRLEVVDILKQIGTEASIGELEKLTKDGFVGWQAKDAIKTIQGRMKK
jgi:hypothetical protein